jgi:hypothetical protein
MLVDVGATDPLGLHRFTHKWSNALVNDDALLEFYQVQKERHLGDPVLVIDSCQLSISSATL